MIGRDSRPSGAQFVSEIVEGLVKSGRTVHDCGIVPTPTVQFVVDDSDAVGGIVVTASHNPEEWNGLKFVGEDGCFLNSEQVETLMALKGGLNDGSPSEEGEHLNIGDAIQRHIDRICNVSWIDLSAIRERHFRVAVDTVNGAAAEALPKLLNTLGCEIIPINCALSGQFTRGTEPLPEHLSDLSRLVRREKCHVGFATDPDGDRLAIIDETGRAIGEEYTLVLALDGFLSTTGGGKPVVTNLSTTLAVDKVAERYGVTVSRSAVGEINVVEMMEETGALMGGEGNGGVILREVHLGRDSLVAAATVLHTMARMDRPLSERVDQLPRFEIVKEKVPIAGNAGTVIFERIAGCFDNAVTDERDGLKLTWSDRWIHVRKSNTEPIMRIYTEAPTQPEAQDLAERIKSMIQK